MAFLGLPAGSIGKFLWEKLGYLREYDPKLFIFLGF